MQLQQPCLERRPALRHCRVPRRHLPALRRHRDASRAEGARGAGARSCATTPSPKPRPRLQDVGLALARRRNRPARSEDSRRPHRAAGAGPRRDHPASAQHSRLGEPGPADYGDPRIDRRDRARGAVAPAAGRARASRRSPKCDRPISRAAPSSRRSPPASARGTEVALLVNRGERSHYYVMPDLIGVPGSRAVDLLRTRGFRVTIVGELPYPACRQASSFASFRRPDSRLPPAIRFRWRSAVEPHTGPHRAVHSLGRLRGAGSGHRRRRKRRRRPDSRGRDGRPLRAEHHHRSAGREVDQAGGAGAARRASDDYGSRPATPKRSSRPAPTCCRCTSRCCRISTAPSRSSRALASRRASC